jgi:hypothetical protein
MRKYLEDGSEIEVISVAKADNGTDIYLYREIYEPEDGEGETSSDIYATTRTFDRPPETKKHAELERLQREINTARAELAEITRSKRAEADRYKELLAKLKLIPALENIEAAINGEVTHFVLVDKYGGTVQIQSASEGGGVSRYNPTRKLALALFVDSEQSTNWQAWYGEYNGHGDFKNVIPCVGLEAAETKARALIARAMDECKGTGYASRLIDNARALGVAVPERLLKLVADEQARVASEELAQARKRLESAEAAARQVGILGVEAGKEGTP